jgi:hypothetical protein
MRNTAAALTHVGRIGAGVLAALSQVTAASAANWVTNWTSPGEWTNYLLVCSFELLVVAILVKLLAPTNASRRLDATPTTLDPDTEYPIGAYRNRVLIPYQ